MGLAKQEFELHPQLASDCALVGDFALSRVLLMNDSRYPWLILVPRRAGLCELHELREDERMLFWRESMLLGRALMSHYGGHKLNVAALGNMVAQLHIHHIVRHTHDAAWPRPVWGVHPALPYAPDILQQQLGGLRALLAQLGLEA